MSQIISPPVARLTLSANQLPGGRVASPWVAVIAIGRAASAAPQYCLREDSPWMNKIEKNTGHAAFISFRAEICSHFPPIPGRRKPLKCNIITMNITYIGLL